MSYDGGVYFILDRDSNALKIGKANNFQERLDDLQVGNPNDLEIIHHIQCTSSDHSIQLEGQLHKKYEQLHMRGEWFRYNEEAFRELIDKGTSLKLNEKRKPLIRSTLWGDEPMFGPKNSPNCYFYTYLSAQILTNYEEAKDMKIPFRVMKYPTNGVPKLIHNGHVYSLALNRVFISTKKHNEILEERRFKKSQEYQELQLAS
jgi:hypothetical protein